MPEIRKTTPPIFKQIEYKHEEACRLFLLLRIPPLSSGGTIVIGRNHFNSLPETDKRFISRTHAEIKYDGKAYWLKDKGSENGTWIDKENNPEPLKPQKYHLILPGSLITLADKEFIFSPDIRPSLDKTIREGVEYYIVNSPQALQFGLNIPGMHPREVIALRADEETKTFLQQASEQAGKGKTEATARRLCGFVRQSFSGTFEDNKKGWEKIQKQYTDLKVSLGYFISKRTGCCRHQAAALQLVYQEVGLNSRFMRGTIKDLRHAWVEVEIGGKWFVADPAQDRFEERNEAYQKGPYKIGENKVEIPVRSVENAAPGDRGTILIAKK